MGVRNVLFIQVSCYGSGLDPERHYVSGARIRKGRQHPRVGSGIFPRHPGAHFPRVDWPQFVKG